MKKLLLSSVVAAGLSFSAQADIQLSGFASVVGGITTDSDKVVRNFDDSLDLTEGSFFALQAYSDLSDGLSATVQIRARGSEDWEPEFTWAFLSYEIDTDWRVQVGRQRIPIYLYSDYLDVSYAYHWIAPPSEVYSAPFDSIDGISTIHDISLGEGTLNLRGYYGKESFDSTLGEGTVEMKDIASIVANYNIGWWTFRTSYLQLEMSGGGGPLNDIAAAWRQTPFAYVGDAFEIKEDDMTAYEFGVLYDNQDWMFLAEYIGSSLEESVFDDGKQWMVSAGKRYNDFMFHGTFGREENMPFNPITQVPNGLSPQLDQVIAFTNQALDAADYSRDFYTLGMRWDFHQSAAFKVEYTNAEISDGSKAGLMQFAIATVF